MMLGKLTSPREKLIYAYALLRGYEEMMECEDAREAMEDVMDIIAEVVHDTWICEKPKEDNENE